MEINTNVDIQKKKSFTRKKKHKCGEWEQIS